MRRADVLENLRQAEESGLALTAKEAGQIIGMTRKHIISSSIPQLRQGRTIRYAVEELRNYVMENLDQYE